MTQSHTKSPRKLLLGIAIPIVLANILQSAYQMTDAFWVGRLGSDAVAAVAVSFPFMFLMMSVGMGISIAGSTLTAQYFGAKDKKMLNHTAIQTILMTFAVAVVFTIAGYTLSPYFLNLIHVQDSIYSLALSFMQITFLGILPTFIFAMFQSLMRGVGEVTFPMYIVLGTVVGNFVLDPLFMFSFNMGINGAAIATVLTQSIAMILGMYVLLTGKYHIHFSLKDMLPDTRFMKKSFMLGLPSTIELSVRAVNIILMTTLVAYYGTIYTASFGVASNIFQLIIIIGLGISLAVSALAGRYIGAGDIENAELVSKEGMKLAFVSLGTIGVIIYVGAEYFVRFFINNDAQVIANASQILHIMAPSFFLIGIQRSMTGVFRAAGDMNIIMVLTVVSQIFLQIPIAYMLSRYTSLGSTGIWYAFPITNVITAGITYYIYKQGNWKHKRLTKEMELRDKISEEILIEEGVKN